MWRGTKLLALCLILATVQLSQELPVWDDGLDGCVYRPYSNNASAIKPLQFLSPSSFKLINVRVEIFATANTDRLVPVASKEALSSEFSEAGVELHDDTMISIDIESMTAFKNSRHVIVRAIFSEPGSREEPRTFTWITELKPRSDEELHLSAPDLCAVDEVTLKSNIHMFALRILIYKYKDDHVADVVLFKDEESEKFNVNDSDASPVKAKAMDKNLTIKASGPGRYGLYLVTASWSYNDGLKTITVPFMLHKQIYKPSTYQSVGTSGSGNGIIIGLIVGLVSVSAAFIIVGLVTYFIKRRPPERATSEPRDSNGSALLRIPEDITIAGETVRLDLVGEGDQFADSGLSSMATQEPNSSHLPSNESGTSGLSLPDDLKPLLNSTAIADSPMADLATTTPDTVDDPLAPPPSFPETPPPTRADDWHKTAAAGSPEMTSQSTGTHVKEEEKLSSEIEDGSESIANDENAAGSVTKMPGPIQTEQTSDTSLCSVRGGELLDSGVGDSLGCQQEPEGGRPRFARDKKQQDAGNHQESTIKDGFHKTEPRVMIMNRRSVIQDSMDPSELRSLLVKEELVPETLPYYGQEETENEQNEFLVNELLRGKKPPEKLQRFIDVIESDYNIYAT